jgi:hypothetical protein
MKEELTKEFLVAFKKLKNDIKPIPFDQKLKVKRHDGSSYETEYATLHNIMASIKESFDKNGFDYIQNFVVKDGIQFLETRIVNVELGESLISSLIIPVNRDIQVIGSQITYLKRYALNTLLNLVTEKMDDDGNTASGNDFYITLVSDDDENLSASEPQKSASRALAQGLSASSAIAEDLPSTENKKEKLNKTEVLDFLKDKKEIKILEKENHISVSGKGTFLITQNLKDMGFIWKPDKKIWVLEISK